MKMSERNERPNVLIILTDQQRYDTINALGYRHMITPNLDKLCLEGCAYTRAHSHNPVCMPARHDLLLGMPAGAHGYFANNENKRMKDISIPTLPAIFSNADYRTAAIGKMHFSPSRAHHGYNEMRLMEELPKHRSDDQYTSYLKEQGYEHIQNIHGVRPHIYHTPQLSQVPHIHHEVSWIKNETIDWLSNNGDAPFFLCVGYIKPHPPWNISEPYKGLYANSDLPEPIDYSRLFPNDHIEGAWFGDDDSTLAKRKIREAYYTTISMVDESVGEIINYLRKTNQLDNTLVIFTSDHGEMLQDKGYYSKQLPYDSSVRIPFIVRYPKRFKANTINNEFVDLLDILPTCLDVCDIAYPGNVEHLYGESLCNEQIKNRNEIICACEFYGPRRWVMSRNERYKYIYRYNDGFEEFYDMQEDPSEYHNIIEEMLQSEIYEGLKKKAIAYEERWGPQEAIKGGEFTKVQRTYFDGWDYGKYHKWSNSQMQRFFEGTKEYKGERLISEMSYALGDEVHSGVKLNEVFQHPEWEEDFMNHFIRYGGTNENQKIIKPMLFKEI
jgi:arylsulfatase